MGIKFLLNTVIFISFSIAVNAQNCTNWLHIPNYNTQDYVSIGDLDMTGNQITVEASFNADTNYFVTGTVSYDLVSKHTGPSDCNYLLRPVTAEITTTNGYYQVVACDYIPKKINHAALVYDGITLKFYRNGFLMGSKPASGNLVTNDLVAKIGNYAFGAEIGALKGYMNEVRIWNIARTQEEIKTYMNVSLPNPNTQPGLVAYYTFDNLNNKQGNSAWNASLHGDASINNIVPNCNFIADSCGGIIPNSCGQWLHIPNYNNQDYVAIGDLDITGNQITVEANFNADTNYFVNGTVSYDLVSKHSTPADCNYLLRPVTAEITTTNGYYQVVACDYIPKKINHAALVYDGTTLNFYRNGFLMGSKPATGNLLTNDLITKIGNFALGSEIGALKGYLNEVRIWNVARTQEQIKTYMNASLPNPTTQSGLIAYYIFDNLSNKEGNSLWDGVLHGDATINNTLADCSFLADSCLAVVPVYITSFNATVLNNKSIITKWHTEHELGVLSYTIERSTSTSGPFISIGLENAIANRNSNNYSFTDNFALPNIKYFYRLRITETTGTIRYSELKSTKINLPGLSVKIFPKPANEFLMVQISNINQTATISIYSNIGQLIIENKMILNNSTNKINIEKLAKGTYWLRIVSGNENTFEKIEKL